MRKTRSQRDKAIHRLKISLGHLKKTLRMAEDHEYCIDVIHQLQAVQQALARTSNVLLENHLRTCVSDAIKKGKDQRAISEIMSILKKYS